MTPSRRTVATPVFRRASLALALLALAGAGPLSAQVVIPLSVQFAELETQLKAKKTGDAAALLDDIVKRAQAGEKLPPGITLEKLLLTAANTNFQAQLYPRAAELGDAVAKLP